MEEDFNSKKKPHRERLSGRKQDKKKAKNDHVQELSDKQRNPKAFAISSAVRAERRFRRTQDLQGKKEHIPVVDRTPLEPPPILVAIVGPPKVGKSTLIRSLIKSYTKQPLTTIKGPVTIVSGKKRRITIVECNNDINSMVDIAKVADLVLLLIDASFGFEMEIFEFLNICQVHGMPKIMGVLTHLDMIKNTKKVQKTKKILKHRFWKEVYPGAKLFYLSKLMHNNYMKNEIKNLARFVSVMKFRPLVWQTTHPYILADRMEDTTPPDQIQTDPKIDRTVCLYGYMRGIPMHKNSFIHIAGSGDYGIEDLSFLPDPCPLPEQIKRRNLLERERVIYAPFSGVGGIVYDKDAVYIELPTRQENDNEFLSALKETKETIDSKLAKSTIQLFSTGSMITAEDFEEQNEKYSVSEVVEDGRKRRKVTFNDKDPQSDIETDDSGVDENEESESESEGKRKRKNSVESNESSKKSKLDADIGGKNLDIRQKISSALEAINKTEEDWSDSTESEDEQVNVKIDEPWNKGIGSDNDESGESDSSDTEVEDTDTNWRNNLVEKANQSYLDRQSSQVSLWKLVYGTDNSLQTQEEDNDNVIGGLFKVVNKNQENIIQNKDLIDGIDSSKFPVPQLRDWSQQTLVDSIKDCFVTGKWSKGEDADELLKLDDMSDQDEELFGDFEDLETGKKFTSNKNKTESELTKEELLQRKKNLKAKFDEEYDTKGGEESSYFEELKMEANKQAELNKKQFEDLNDSVRVEIEGYRAGMYVRIQINKVPCEFVENFDASYPIVIGGLQPGEQNVGYVKVRIKKHRWYNKILKTRDPLIISMGWRRFQTISVYSKQEDNMRHRMLKYTPEHVACMGHFWGPMTKAGTGFLAILSSEASKAQPGFRIVASGSVVDTNQTTIITKKLKLTGTPTKIFKKSAFINGMFNSSLEVAKFEGAKIKTVSGIRGQIKKPLSQPEGAFRATFEDKILLSDIVFCRTWFRVDVPKFYVPVTSLLLPPDKKNEWQGMRTLGMIKRDQGIKNEAQPDSLYTEIVRPRRVNRPLVIPRALERELPFKYKAKVKETKHSAPFMGKVKKVVVRDDHEAEVASMMDKLIVNYKIKTEKLREDKKNRLQKFRKQLKNEEIRKFRKHKEIKKSIYRSLSKMETKKEKQKQK